MTNRLVLDATMVPLSTASEPARLVEVQRTQLIVSVIVTAAVAPELPSRLATDSAYHPENQ
jgi:hypothetical protein